MLNERRLLLALGAAGSGLAVAAFVSMASAHADPCSHGECTLVSGGNPTDVLYQGFRPVFTEWTDNQPTNVEVAGSDFAGGVSGSYNVSELDVATPYVDDVTYQFGNFTPAADNPGGIDSDGLAGAVMHDVVLGPGSKIVDGVTTYKFENVDVQFGNGDQVVITSDPGAWTNFNYSTPTESGDWIQFAGSSTPTMVYDTLPSPSFPTEVFNLAGYLPPDLWFPDFNSAIPNG
jgi:hypothetical protein